MSVEVDDAVRLQCRVNLGHVTDMPVKSRDHNGHIYTVQPPCLELAKNVEVVFDWSLVCGSDDKS